MSRVPVDFWFDPACPWAWLASRWLLEVARVREVEPRWHVMSLAIMHEDEPRDRPDRRWGPVRVCVAAARAHGPEVLGRLYTALGRRIVVERRLKDPRLFEEALAEAGLPPALGAAATSEEYDDALRASHDEGVHRVGLGGGTPVVAVGETAFLGPVVTPAPKGEAAGRLWDGVLLLVGTPGFAEIKRTRTADPVFD